MAAQVPEDERVMLRPVKAQMSSTVVLEPKGCVLGPGVKIEVFGGVTL
jgi:hypothetical protein